MSNRRITFEEDQAKGVCDITIVLDSSGSMGAVQRETIDAFNNFIAEQREIPGDAYLTLVSFASESKVTIDAENIRDVANLDPETYRPGGGTALRDAIGEAVVMARARYVKAQPEKRVLVIMTDGEDNESREHSPESVRALISQCEKDGWLVIFLGSDLANWSDQASRLGVMSANNTASWGANATGVYGNVAAVSRTVLRSRGFDYAPDSSDESPAYVVTSTTDGANMADVLADAKTQARAAFWQRSAFPTSKK